MTWRKLGLLQLGIGQQARACRRQHVPRATLAFLFVSKHQGLGRVRRRLQYVHAPDDLIGLAIAWRNEDLVILGVQVRLQFRQAPGWTVELHVGLAIGLVYFGQIIARSTSAAGRGWRWGRPAPN